MFRAVFLKMEVFYNMITTAYKKCKNCLITDYKDFGNDKVVVVVAYKNCYTYCSS